MQSLHPGRGYNRAVQQQMFDLLADPTARTIIRRTAEAPRTQQWLVANINPNKKTRIGDLIRWFAVLGILSGSAKRGYRLAVGELVDVIDAVQRGPLKDGLWRVLRKPTGRAVLVALAHGDRTSSELVMTGERTQVYRCLDTLQVAGVVRDIRVDGKTIYGLLEPGHYSWILGAVELIVAHLAHQTATGAIDSVQRLAYPTSPALDFEPAAHGPLPPPDSLARPLTGDQGAVTAKEQATGQILDDLTHPGLAGDYAIARLRGSLVAVPPRSYPWLDVEPWGTDYIDHPRVVEALLSALPAYDKNEDEFSHFWAALANMGDKQQRKPYTPSQLRGHARSMVLAGAEPYSPRDLQLPAIRWHAERSPYEVDAATFDEDTNILTIDPYWRGLLTTLAQWIEQPFSVLGWIERIIRFRHAMKLIERVLLHEEFVASRVQARPLPQLTPDALTFAAHWTALEHQALRQHVHQHRAHAR